METFLPYLEKITNPAHLARVKEVLEWVFQTFPNLEARIAWNQPMFTDHGTFIIGFSVSAPHMAISPEGAGMVHFKDEIAKAGYSQGKMLFRIKWEEPVNYELLKSIISYNIEDKADCNTFWRQ